MIPAKITNLNPPQVTGYRLPEPNPDNYVIGFDYEYEEYVWDDLRYYADMKAYEDSKFIADVENAINGYAYIEKIGYLIRINQSCFIEPTGEGKCKIIRL